MNRLEAQTAPSSKRFVKEIFKRYGVGIFAERILEKLGDHLSRDVVSSFSDYFLTVVQDDLVDKGASFNKVRDAYEKTISKLSRLSEQRKDPFAIRVANRLINDGEHMLLRLNPEFDSDKWCEVQREVIYPGISAIPPKSSSVFS